MGQIKVIVDRIGDTKFEAEGFVGESCKNATEAMEMALQGKGDTQHKPEFYESDKTAEAEKNYNF